MKLKNKIRKDLCLSDEDFIGIISEQYEEYLIYKEYEMKRSKKKFMEAHGITLEVLGKNKEGEILSETFNKTGC